MAIKQTQRKAWRLLLAALKLTDLFALSAAGSFLCAHTDGHAGSATLQWQLYRVSAVVGEGRSAHSPTGGKPDVSPTKKRLRIPHPLPLQSVREHDCESKAWGGGG